MEYIKRLNLARGRADPRFGRREPHRLWIAGQKYHSAGLAPDAAEAQLPVFACRGPSGWAGTLPGRARSRGSSPSRRGQRVSPERLAAAPGDTVRGGHELWRDSARPGRSGAGRRRRGGAQPHLDNHTLPPRRRLGRRPHRLRRGPRRQAAAAGTRGRET